MEIKRIAFLGCPLHLITPAEVLEQAAKALRGRGRLRIEGLNVAKLVEARGDPALMAALREAELVHVDGAGISLGLNVLGMAAPERRAGIDLMGDLCGLAAVMDSGVYLLGARLEVVQAAAQRLADSTPGLKIAGIRDGYFAAAQEAEVVQDIQRSGAGVLFIGISSPKKERFLQAHWHQLGVAVGMGVGGSFDVVSGVLRRAPLWMQRYGLEWLYRLKQEPVRLFERYARTNFYFLCLLVRARLGAK
ncbi:WecB/TagA/CpsF family glycosyltransferase [Methylomonas fluvii]|uniref:WecB/TagA/CpsF family glycosyltransferase n=1 Tax=Methylomonas fluvii TaxID=1854564 RepID=A0ABR9DH85_9GAMM|nr:WecB/TagA/CpsF family glycosyltransferase [Methylomonas fluvii]MBD9362435.1 WecB/TagA/CpsF family glycosyltransferase [Methylomonas fluvii]CAD6875535.1 glycosyl transferase, WecB/TagA/CpsF family [Methylomonas fluvii]